MRDINYCPICGEYFINSLYFNGNYRCANNHYWHHCLIHSLCPVLGKINDSRMDCDCTNVSYDYSGQRIKKNDMVINYTKSRNIFCCTDITDTHYIFTEHGLNTIFEKDISRKDIVDSPETETFYLSSIVKVKINQLNYTRWKRYTDTYFISGHRDITNSEFEIHYIPKINIAIEKGVNFVIGDYEGADNMSLAYLEGVNYDKVKVYHMHKKPKYNYNFECIGGFTTDESRDSAMTLVSNMDILYVREGKAGSGTDQNRVRRLKEEAKIDEQ